MPGFFLTSDTIPDVMQGWGIGGVESIDFCVAGRYPTTVPYWTHWTENSLRELKDGIILKDLLFNLPLTLL